VSTERSSRRRKNSSISIRELKREYTPLGIPEDLLPLYDERPQTRDDCEGGERPCPWVSCQYHLYLDVDPNTGSIKLNFPKLESWELAQTCAWDVADRGGATLTEVGGYLNVTRERARQIELIILRKLRHDPRARDLVEGLRASEEENTERSRHPATTRASSRYRSDSPRPRLSQGTADTSEPSTPAGPSTSRNEDPGRRT
jgi:hypothetical protein